MAQASSVYDPDADERPKHAPSDDELRNTAGIDADEESTMDSEALRDAEESGSGFYNPRGDSRDKSGSDKKELDDAESQAGSLYNPASDKGKRGIPFSKGQLVKTVLKSKWLIGGAVSGGGMIALIILLLVVLSSLKIPNLMQHIVAYQFARFTRQYATSATEVTDEALAVQATDQSTYQQYKDRFTAGKEAVRNKTWGKLDKYRPAKVVNNLAKEGDMKFTYETSPLGRTRLAALSFGGEKFNIKPVTGAKRFIPGVNSLLEARNQADAYRLFRDSTQRALGLSNSKWWVRSLVANRLRKAAGISLVAWILSRFPANDETKARLEEVRELDTKTTEAERATDNAKTEQIQEGEQAAKDAKEAVMSNDAELEQAINDGGIAKRVDKAISSAVSSSWTQNVLGAVNTVYAIVLPICIIYDGSVAHSQPTIDNQTAQQEAIFYHFASAADEQNTGTRNPHEDANLNAAIKATNDTLGDITQSDPEIQASGGTVNTTSTVSAEAGAGGFGTYSIFNLLGFNKFFANIANTLADNYCSTLTDTKIAVGIGIANIVAAVLSFGGSEAATESVGLAARSFIKNFSDLSIKRIFAKKLESKAATDVIARSSLSRGWKWAVAKNIGKAGGGALATIGATEIARLIISSRAGLVNDGLAQGTDLVNANNAGGNLVAGKMSEALGGRPLTHDELVAENAKDVTFVQQQNESKSFTERYFAVTNADSLVTRFGMSIQSAIGQGVFNSFITYVGSILQPFKLASMFHLAGVAKAATDPTLSDYGNVQFGWSDDEEKLIMGNASYKPLENREILDNSGKLDIIGKTYAKCFGYAYNPDGNGDLSATDKGGNLQPDPNASIGHLLADSTGGLDGNPSIVRDADGNVLDEGDCSPTNLGPNNPTYQDLVFRFRLALSYDSTLDQLTDMQNVTQ